MGVWGRGSTGGTNWSPGLLDRAETFDGNDGETVTTLTDYVSVANGEVTLTDYDSENIGSYLGAGAEYTASFSYEMKYVQSIEVTCTCTVVSVVVGGTQIGSSAGTYDTSDYSGTLEVTITDDDENSESVTVYPTGNPTSGRFRVEWPMPDDLAGWDIIPWNAAEGEGNVKIYAVDPSDGSELAGPLDDPGDISDLSRSINVAVEVVIERPPTAASPVVEAVYRRRKIT